MAVDHFGNTIIVGTVVEIIVIAPARGGIKLTAGWPKKLTKMRKHSRLYTVTAIDGVTQDLTMNDSAGIGGHVVPPRYVKIESGTF